MLTAGINKPFFHRSDKILPWIANGIMLFFLSYLFSQLGTQLLELLNPVDQPVLIAAADTVQKRHRPSAGNMSRQLASLHLFGQPSRKKTRPVKKQIVAPETKLNFTLRGIVAENHKHAGFAIIQNNNKKDEKHFSVKQEVFGLAKLEEIYQDRVILLRNGKYETLRLPEKSIRLADTGKEGVVSKYEQGKMLHNYRKAILSGDHGSFVGLVDYDEAYDDDGFKGFILIAESEKGKDFLHKLGLKHNDVIVSVDGVELRKDLQSAKQIYKFGTATSINVGIERDNSPMSLSFEIPKEFAREKITTPTNHGV